MVNNNNEMELMELSELDFNQPEAANKSATNSLQAIEEELFSDQFLPEYQLYRLQARFKNDLRFCAINEERDYLSKGLSLIKRQLRMHKLQQQLYCLTNGACNVLLATRKALFD